MNPLSLVMYNFNNYRRDSFSIISLCIIYSLTLIDLKFNNQYFDISAIRVAMLQSKRVPRVSNYNYTVHLAYA